MLVKQMQNHSQKRKSTHMSSWSIQGQINALFHLSQALSNLQKPPQVDIFFAVGCAQLKSQKLKDTLRNTIKERKKCPSR